MERDLAERMMAAVQSLGSGLKKAALITEAMQDQAEAKLLSRHLGSVMADPLYEIFMHVVRQYPDLDPDKQQSRP